MKKLIILLVLLLLTGCTKIDVSSTVNDLDSFLDNIDFDCNARANHITDYFEYYIPSDAYEIEGTDNAAVIEVNKAKMVMNLNIKAILNSKYYNEFTYTDEGFFKDDVLIYEKEGEFVCDDGHGTYYNIKLYDHDNQYLVHFVCDNLSFYCLANSEDLKEAVRHMIIIAKSCNVNKDTLIAKYSAKDVIEYQKKQVDLFEYVMPNSGYLSEMVNHVNGSVQNEVVEVPQGEEDIEEENEEDVDEEEDIE